MRFTQIKHPGYSSNEKSIKGCELANYMSNFIASITCGSKIDYLIAKIFEIPATGSLLLLNDEIRDQVKTLGFEPNEHYIPYNYENLDETADYVLNLDNRAKIDRIRMNGQRLVRQYHTVENRSNQIDTLAHEFLA